MTAVRLYVYCVSTIFLQDEVLPELEINEWQLKAAAVGHHTTVYSEPRSSSSVGSSCSVEKVV